MLLNGELWGTTQKVDEHVRFSLILVFIKKSVKKWLHWKATRWKYYSSFTSDIVLPPSVNLLHLYISMQIFHSVLLSFFKVLTGRICLTIKSLSSWWSFPLLSTPKCLINKGWTYVEKWDASHFWVFKG